MSLASDQLDQPRARAISQRGLAYCHGVFQQWKHAEFRLVEPTPVHDPGLRPGSGQEKLPAPSGGRGDGACISSLRCNDPVKTKPVCWVEPGLDLHKSLVVRSEGGSGQCVAVFPMTGKVEVDAATMPERHAEQNLHRQACLDPGIAIGGLSAALDHLNHRCSTIDSIGPTLRQRFVTGCRIKHL